MQSWLHCNYGMDRIINTGKLWEGEQLSDFWVYFFSIIIIFSLFIFILFAREGVNYLISLGGWWIHFFLSSFCSLFIYFLSHTTRTYSCLLKPTVNITNSFVKQNTLFHGHFHYFFLSFLHLFDWLVKWVFFTKWKHG